MMQKLCVLLGCLLVLIGANQAQKYAVFTGDFSLLRNQKVQVKFDYQGMTMGEMPNEQAYIEKRMAEYDARKPGKGAEWLAEWKEIRTLSEVEFVKWFNKKIKKYGVVASLHNDQAPYTIVLKAISLEIGWSGGLVSEPGIIIWQLMLYRSNDMDHTIAEMNIYGVQDYETIKGRMTGMYRMTAVNFARFLHKQVFK